MEDHIIHTIHTFFEIIVATIGFHFGTNAYTRWRRQIKMFKKDYITLKYLAITGILVIGCLTLAHALVLETSDPSDHDFLSSSSWLAGKIILAFMLMLIAIRSTKSYIAVIIGVSITSIVLSYYGEYFLYAMIGYSEKFIPSFILSYSLWIIVKRAYGGNILSNISLNPLTGWIALTRFDQYLVMTITMMLSTELLMVFSECLLDTISFIAHLAQPLALIPLVWAVNSIENSGQSASGY